MRVLDLGLVALSAGLILGLFGAFAPALDSFGHFRLQLVVMLVAAVLVFVSMQLWRRALIAGVLALTGFAMLGPVLDQLPSTGPEKDIRIMSFNMSFQNGKIQEFLKTVRSERPDVIALQEVARRNEAVLAYLKPDYPSQTECYFSGVGRAVVLSRFKIQKDLPGGCLRRRGFVWMTVQAGRRRVTIASIHLHWPWPYGQDQQIRGIDAKLRALPRPVILAGDFNAAPWSAAVSRVASASDTHIVPGLRLTIWVRPFRYVPSVPLQIDHVLTSASLRPVAARTLGSMGSDHRAVLVDLKWR